MRLSSIFGIAALALAGCASNDVAVLNPQAAHVQIISGSPLSCQPLGDVYGRSTAEGDPEAAMQGARADLRNRTAAMGGTHVVLQQSSSDASRGMWQPAKEVTLAGAAYRCDAAPPVAQPGPPGGA